MLPNNFKWLCKILVNILKWKSAFGKETVAFELAYLLIHKFMIFFFRSNNKMIDFYDEINYDIN